MRMELEPKAFSTPVELQREAEAHHFQAEGPLTRLQRFIPRHQGLRRVHERGGATLAKDTSNEQEFGGTACKPGMYRPGFSVLVFLDDSETPPGETKILSPHSRCVPAHGFSQTGLRRVHERGRAAVAKDTHDPEEPGGSACKSGMS